MAILTRAEFNALFVTGHKITQAEWVDIVDTFWSRRDDNLRPSSEPLLSGSDLELDCNRFNEIIFEPDPRPINGGSVPIVNISFLNQENTDVILIHNNITGTVVYQFPTTPFSGREEVRASATPSGITAWDNATKQLTISGVTESKFPISLVWNESGSYFDLRCGEVVV